MNLKNVIIIVRTKKSILAIEFPLIGDTFSFSNSAVIILVVIADILEITRGIVLANHRNITSRDINDMTLVVHKRFTKDSNILNKFELRILAVNVRKHYL